jgi:carbon-monoxide dehydrogenase medium subunit
MKPPAFAYRRPESLAEALDVLAQAGDEARPLAGGQSLVPLLAMRLARPRLVVDLQRVPELRGIETGPGLLRAGAMTREAELERAAGLPEVVAAALPHVGHFQIRSRGTVGGSLAHMDPAAEWPALALLLDAELEAASVRGAARSRLPTSRSAPSPPPWSRTSSSSR